MAERRFIVSLIILMGCLKVVSVNSPSANGYAFKHYNINNGLSQNTVHSILQDRQGFMWFGTKDGLNRFDGNSFKIFKFSPEGNLRENIFNRIVQDDEDNLWLGTSDGIYIYNPRTERFLRFEEKTTDGFSIEGIVRDLLIDNDGDIWVSVEERGVFLYDVHKDILTRYVIPQSSGGMSMMTLCEGTDGNVWAFPYNRPFVRINKKTGSVVPFELMDDPELFYHTGEIWDALADEYNELLFTSSTMGLISVNLVNGTHCELLSKDANNQPIFGRCLARIDNHTIWLGTESGLYIYHSKTGEASNLRHNLSVPYSLSDNAIYSIYKDREGGVWVGSFFGGVNYYSELLSRFELFYPIPGINQMKGNRVREFCSSSNDTLWIGTEDDGLNLFNPQTGKFLPLPEPLHSLYTNIHALYVDGDDFWISTFSKGLHKYNFKTDKLTTYVHSDDTNSISQNTTYSICKDRQGTLWFGNLSGLSQYNPDKDIFINLPQFESIYVQDIFEDKEGKIWVSTYAKGLHCYDPISNEWKVFLYDETNPRRSFYNKLTSVFEDSHKRLWVTSEGGGFYLFDSETEEFTVYNSEKGLPNDVVYQIVEDNDHKLWLSTNGGLVRFNPETETFTNFTVKNGLKTNQFNYKSSFKSPDGTIYFGSVDGFVRFKPSAFKDIERKVPIVFTEFSINNNPISPAEQDSPLKESILYAESIMLPYQKNSFSIRYAILNFSSAVEGNLYYRLEGFDDGWIDAKAGQPIVYSNLNPGDYLLTISLKDNRDVILASKSIAIHIKPPFWLTSWAFLIYFLLLITGIILLMRNLHLWNLRSQRQQMNLYEQQKERELYRSKIDFFTNVAHEIRTPLSLIKAPLDHLLATEKMSENVSDNLKIMRKNTDRLLNLTNQLLDFRKTESEAYALNFAVHDVSELIRDTVLQFSPMAIQRSLLFEVDIPDEDMFFKVDKEAFLKILGNLLNNAIKYSDSYVRINAFLRDDTFHLVVANDGEMIPPEHRSEIFKPFVRVERRKNPSVSGTGIGLALSKSLAELHKGTLTLEPDSEDIRFHLVLPAGNVNSESIGSEDLSSKVKPLKEELSVNKTYAYTILLVDDDADLLQFEKKVLSADYRILTAENGNEALEVLNSDNVSLIVTDIMMPGMDGFELTRQVKQNIEFCHIPVILLTAKVSVEAKIQGFETGADAYIDKPFSIEVLTVQIANLLQNREKLRESFMKNPFVGANSMVRTKSDEEFIKKLHEIVHDNLGNAEFVVEDIAEQFNMSRASFYRKIKGVLDLTPNEYIRVERLKRAAQLLKEKTFKVNEICYMVGFNSPSYFAKCFQQQFGVLPKDFEQIVK